MRPVPDQVPIKRALVSVYDKAGLEELVRGLHDAGVELVSTGGSAALIEGVTFFALIIVGFILT